jgi:hypothetical protein
MTRNQYLRELVFPLTDLVVLTSIVAFTLLTALAQAAGLLGLWLGVILAPAVFRYLLMLLEARAYGRVTPVASIEVFGIIENFWSLASLVIFAMLIWGSVLLAARVSPVLAQAFAALVLAIAPASLAVLAITYSPVESFNPAALARMIRACGWRYVLAPLTVVVVLLVTSALASLGAPDVVNLALRCYALFLLFTFTGALLHASGVQFFLTVENADNAALPQPEDVLSRSRRRVMNHAYGFFTRDNRAGAMKHVEAAIKDESDVDDAYRWYFDEMLKWESRDAALLLAQSWLTRLLDEERDVEAVKLISRCLLENPRFRPLTEDLDAALELAMRMKRDDLVRTLED